jgi:transcription-repair coupling factor (superfamily II helicase)
MAAVREDLTDRYGPPPAPLKRLLKVAELRVVCAGQGIRQVETRDDKAMLKADGDYLMQGHRFPRLKGGSADAKLDETIRLARTCRRWSRD